MNRQTIKQATAALVMLGALGWWALGVACEQQTAPANVHHLPEIEHLTIITPHNEKIREVFERGFSDWHEAQRGAPVDIDWIVRGTPRCTVYIAAIFAGESDARVRQTPDLMFGGGIADHQFLAERGYAMPLVLDDAVADIPAVMHGLPTRSAEGTWYATGLSSFGVVFNRRDCARRGIAAPTTWADLAAPRFAGRLGVADPQDSGSYRQSMMLLTEKLGWAEGWSTIIRILANAPAVLDSSSTVLDQVESGVFLAAFAVNFDGLARAEESGGAVVYVNPPGATAVTPDVTSALKTAHDVGLVEDFVRYCLSDEGQLAWGAKAERHALSNQTLYHYPIVPRVYEQYAADLAVIENPFKVDFGLRMDLERAGRLSTALAPLIRSAAGDNHIALQQAWAAVIAGGMKPEAFAELTTLPFDEDAAYELGVKYRAAQGAEAEALLADWTRMFNEKYARVMEMAK